MGNEKYSTKYLVLQMLRQSAHPLSGEEIARHCNVSRTSVWKAVKALNEAGYVIKAEPLGYVLDSDLKDSIYPWEFGKKEKLFSHFPLTQSTMIQARKIAEQGDFKESFQIVTADRQTDGRGQKGRSWKTTDGSLAFTLVTNPKLPVMLSQRTVMACQIALVNALKEVSPRSFYLRWPNDIWSEKGKVAGILEESFSVAGISKWQNVGIGVNIFSSPNMQKTDSIFQTKSEGMRKKIIASFCAQFNSLSKEVTEQSSSLEKKWNSLCADVGKKIFLKEKNTSALFKGIDSYGRAIFYSQEKEQKIIPGTFSLKK